MVARSAVEVNTVVGWEARDLGVSEFLSEVLLVHGWERWRIWTWVHQDLDNAARLVLLVLETIRVLISWVRNSDAGRTNDCAVFPLYLAMAREILGWIV